LETEIRQQGPENVAAFVAEPVVGAALAAVPAPPGYFHRIREICDEYEVLFIADEVMSGWGRTGKWFAIEHWDVAPDIIALGKGLGAGYTPIAATVARNDLWEVIEGEWGAFLAGHTMNQNAVSCAAALAVLEFMEAKDLLTHVQDLSEYFRAQMDQLMEIEIIGDVRGLGFLYGFEFVADRETKLPFDPALGVATRFVQEALKLGLVGYACTGSVDGAAGDMNLVAPPLVITREQIDEMVGLMKEALIKTSLELT
jgi:adenosylmethionine-8-amino-7-oxononanoate aminotransferase